MHQNVRILVRNAKNDERVFIDYERYPSLPEFVEFFDQLPVGVENELSSDQANELVELIYWYPFALTGEWKRLHMLRHILKDGYRVYIGRK